MGLFSDFQDFLTCDPVKYESRNDAKASILSYDIRYMLTIGWLLPKHGSVFTPVQQILIVGTIAGLTTVLANFSCDPKDKSQSSLCVALPIPQTSYMTLMTLCSFVVAFFANTVITRWWNIRLHLGRVTGRSGMLLTHVVGALTSALDHCTAEDKPERIKFAKKFCYKLRGYLITGFRLLINSARDVRTLDDLVERGVISEAEVEYFGKLSGHPLNAYSLIPRIIQQATSQGLLDHTNANVINTSEDLSFVCGNVGEIIVYIDTQLSYPFVQIFTSVVYAFLIQLIYVCASFIAQGIREGDNPSYTTGYLTIILYSFVLLGLLKLAEVLENPLGHDSADLPVDTYCMKLEKSTKSIIDSMFAFVESGENEENILSWMKDESPHVETLSPSKEQAVEVVMAADDTLNQAAPASIFDPLVTWINAQSTVGSESKSETRTPEFLSPRKVSDYAPEYSVMQMREMKAFLDEKLKAEKSS